MLQVMNHFFRKNNIIFKQNILINFIFSKNYSSFTRVRTLENTFIVPLWNKDNLYRRAFRVTKLTKALMDVTHILS